MGTEGDGSAQVQLNQEEKAAQSHLVQSWSQAEDKHLKRQ